MSGGGLQIDPLQGLKKIGCRPIAPLGILVQRLLDDRRQRHGHLGIQARGRRWLPVQELIEDGGERLAGERRAAGRHLEDHGAERKDVGAGIDRLAERLLRSHITGGPEREAVGRRVTSHGRGLRIRGGRRPEELGQSEVENLDPFLGGDHHVAGLQIPVQDTRGVRARQAVSQLAGDGQCLRQRQRGARSQELAQAPSGHQLHGQEDQPVQLLDRVDVDDVRMVERGGRAGFPLKPGAAIDRVGDLGSRQLERHLPGQPGVLGDIDLAHPAAAQAFEHEVVAEPFPDHRQPSSTIRVCG